MKKIVTVILLLCMVLSLSACGKAEITMQEIYDANQTEALIQNHQSIYICDEMDGESWGEIYLTADYVYEFFPDEEFPLAKFLTDDACYYSDAGNKLLYLFITPDGAGDFASDRAERTALTTLIPSATDYIIESTSKKDGHITVTSVMSSECLEALAEDGLTAGKFEYVLDAKTHEIISMTSDYTYDDGISYHVVTKVSYDAEAPELLKEFLAYETQTESLRNVTVVINPGTEKETSQSIQAPKGLIIGFEYDEDLAYSADFYSDAACTEPYDPYLDTESDLTIYVTWTE